MNYRYSLLGTCAWFCAPYQQLTFYDVTYWHLVENCLPCFCHLQGWGP